MTIIELFFFLCRLVVCLVSGIAVAASYLVGSPTSPSEPESVVKLVSNPATSQR